MMTERLRPGAVGWEQIERVYREGAAIEVHPDCRAAVEAAAALVARAALGERLNGTIKTHVAYAVPKARENTVAKGPGPDLIPHLKGVVGQKLAQSVQATGRLKISLGADRFETPLGKEEGALIAGIDGRRALGEIARAARLDPLTFNAHWGRVEKALTDFGLLVYSGLGRR